MALDSAELVQHARDCASRGDDLYALLGVDATTPKDDIHRAWRRAGLKYHPDKAGDSYDPAKYESFERARDVLCDPPAREAYDNGLRAVLQKKRRVEEMSSERRRFVEELERAEREAKRPKTETDGGLTQADRSRVAEAGRRRMEERARLVQEAEERSRQREKERPDTPGAAPAATAATAADKERVSTPTVSAGREEQKPSQEASPSVSKSSNGDEYDDRIAELEKRLKEKQERKAARKTDKRSRESDISSLSSRRSPPAAGDTPTKPPPPPNPADESKADGEKAPPEPRSFSFRPYAASAPSSPATTKTGSGSLPQFATTMARLKAAQARREEEKRKRAETASEQAA